MPIDHKRINGPDESQPYELFAGFKQPLETPHPSVEGQKQIYLRHGVVNQAKGSAYIEIGQTKAIVSVFDPREIPNRTDYSLQGEIYCEFKYAPFSCKKRKLHQQNNEEKLFSSLMRKSLESVVCLHELPNFQVDVYGYVLEEDGDGLSGCIIAAGAALAHAGVPMYDLITAATTCMDDGVITVAKLSTHKQIALIHQNGHFSIDSIKGAVKMLSKRCDNIVPIVQKCLVKEVLNKLP